MSIKPLSAPRGGPRKNKGNKKNRKANDVLQSPSAPESPRNFTHHADLCPSPTSRVSVMAPRCPHSPSLPAPAEGFDQRQQAGTLLQAPGPILQCQLIDLQMSGESTEKHKGGRDDQSPVAQDVEKRALQRAWLCFQAIGTLLCSTPAAS